MRTLTKHIRIFNRIAGIYNLFYSYQQNMYRKALRNGSAAVPWDRVSRVLDVGCGTGAFTGLWAELGRKVVGVDASDAMIRRARNNTRNLSGITFLVADALAGLPFEDNSFDLTYCSYVAHGLSREHRLQLYREMCRVSRIMVIIHDYNAKRSLLTDAVEALEGGDYFNFINEVTSELHQHICDLQVLPIGKRSSWYICIKEGEKPFCRLES